MSGERKKIEIAGSTVEWDLGEGLHLWNGAPALSMWDMSTVGGMMAGLQQMVGTERFNLSLQARGRDSIASDWPLISKHPTFEDGFAALADIAAAAGWGKWRVASLDRVVREARFQVANCWESAYQKALGVCWGSSLTAGKFSGLCGKIFNTNCWAEQTSFIARGDALDEFIVRPSQTTEEEELSGLFTSSKATAADLAVALAKLRQEVEERQQVEIELRDKLAFIRRQEEAIRAMSTPIIQIWDGVLTLPVVGSLDSARASSMMEQLLAEIVRTRARFAIIDLTGVDVVDTGTANHLLKIMRAVELLGARCVVTGIRPGVAQTMASLGVDLASISTLRNLQEGLKACMRWIEKERAQRE
jgi:rsbT co-antagonist protein RsbR